MPAKKKENVKKGPAAPEDPYLGMTDEERQAEEEEAQSRKIADEQSAAVLKRLKPVWQAWLSSLDDVQRRVLEKYTLTVDGLPQIIEYDIGDGSVGYGAKMELATAKRLMAIDITPNHAWTDWVFFQAGGGVVAKNKKDACIMTVRAALFAKKGASGRMWEKYRAEVEAMAECADEDALPAMEWCFGYFRTWENSTRPRERGDSTRLGIYDRVERAAKAFLPLLGKAAEMNQLIKAKAAKPAAADGDEPEDAAAAAVAAEGHTPVPVTPEAIRSIEAMAEAAVRVRHFFAALTAADDLRVAEVPVEQAGGTGAPALSRQTLYDDDYLTMIAPLTYAAAVRFGNDAWSWCSTADFERAVRNPSAPNPWRALVDSGSSAAYVTIHVPWASTVQYGQDSKRHRYNDLAVVVDRMGGARVYDEMGKMYPFGTFKSMMQDGAVQPEIEPDTLRWHPIRPPTRLQNTTPNTQVTEVLGRLEQAIETFRQWLVDNREQIVGDTFATTAD